MKDFTSFLTEGFPPQKPSAGNGPKAGQKPAFGAKKKPAVGPKKPGAPFPPSNDGGQDVSASDDPFGAGDMGPENPFAGGDEMAGFQQAQAEAEHQAKMEADKAALERQKEEEEARQVTKKLRAAADLEIADQLNAGLNDADDTVTFYPDMMSFQNYKDKKDDEDEGETNEEDADQSSEEDDEEKADDADKKDEDDDSKSSDDAEEDGNDTGDDAESGDDKAGKDSKKDSKDKPAFGKEKGSDDSGDDDSDDDDSRDEDDDTSSKADESDDEESEGDDDVERSEKSESGDDVDDEDEDELSDSIDDPDDEEDEDGENPKRKGVGKTGDKSVFKDDIEDLDIDALRAKLDAIGKDDVADDTPFDDEDEENEDDDDDSDSDKGDLVKKDDADDEDGDSDEDLKKGKDKKPPFGKKKDLKEGAYDSYGRKKQRIDRYMVKCCYCKKVFAIEGAPPWQRRPEDLLPIIEKHVKDCPKSEIRIRYRIKPYQDDYAKELPEYFDTAKRARAAYDMLTTDYKMSQVEGVFDPEEKCGPKCQSSKGPSCECSCGGKNHGSAWS